MVTPHTNTQSPWNNNQQNITTRTHQQIQGNFTSNDQGLNTMRQLGSFVAGQSSMIQSPQAPAKQFSLISNGQQMHTVQTQLSGGQAPNMMTLNSTRVVPSNKAKHIDSKMSSLRHE